jgi:hypothetical protein
LTFEELLRIELRWKSFSWKRLIRTELDQEGWIRKEVDRTENM